MKNKKLFKLIDKDRKLIQCTACAHRCVIAPNKSGLCGVRMNKDGQLKLLVEGQVAAVNIDPIEKKPLFHFYPGEKIFSIGTIGCNFTCSFCQNWDISQALRLLKQQKRHIKLDDTDFGYKLEPQEVIDYCQKHNIKLIAFTYNEPTIFTEYAIKIMKLAKKHNIKGVFVSNGYQTKETLELLEPYIDAFNIDLKSFSNEFYKKICGAKLEPVLKTIHNIYKMKKWLEITTLLIPEENDTTKEINQIAKFIASISKNIPWHISAFHPDFKMLDKKITPQKVLLKAYNIGKKHGLNYIYLGNILDSNFSNTICPKCGKILIKRKNFTVNQINIIDSKCRYCQQTIAGIWD